MSALVIATVAQCIGIPVIAGILLLIASVCLMVARDMYRDEEPEFAWIPGLVGLAFGAWGAFSLVGGVAHYCFG